MPVTPELVVVRSPTATATTSSSSSKSGGIVVPGRGGSHLPRRASHRPDSESAEPLNIGPDGPGAHLEPRGQILPGPVSTRLQYCQ